MTLFLYFSEMKDQFSKNLSHSSFSICMLLLLEIRHVCCSKNAEGYDLEKEFAYLIYACDSKVEDLSFLSFLYCLSLSLFTETTHQNL